jgi:hypothetical protein
MEDVVEQENEATDNGVLLRKQGWFLGELSDESAREILQTCQEFNVFIVHQTPAQDYTLSARFSIEGTDEGIIEHLVIIETDEGKYQITGDDHSYDSVVEVVNSYTALREPPLLPALGEHNQLDRQLSASMSAPPSYTEANQDLQPDIAPLPNINNITPENITEAKTGRLSPTGSIRVHDYYDSYSRDRSDTPDYMHNSHCWRYRDKCCCHPKNAWHCCCHRKSRWNGRREVVYGKWYDCRGTGFCRFLLLFLMWCFIWPCVGFGLAIFGCFCLCYFCCCYEDDD